MDSWQTKKSCVFLGQKSMRQWISAKKQLYCMSCMSLSVVMTYVRDGPTQCVTPLLEFLTKKNTKRTWQDIGWLYLASSIQRTLPEIGITVI